MEFACKVSSSRIDLFCTRWICPVVFLIHPRNISIEYCDCFLSFLLLPMLHILAHKRMYSTFINMISSAKSPDNKYTDIVSHPPQLTMFSLNEKCISGNQNQRIILCCDFYPFWEVDLSVNRVLGVYDRPSAHVEHILIEDLSCTGPSIGLINIHGNKGHAGPVKLYLSG